MAGWRAGSGAAFLPTRSGGSLCALRECAVPCPWHCGRRPHQHGHIDGPFSGRSTARLGSDKETRSDCVFILRQLVAEGSRPSAHVSAHRDLSHRQSRTNHSPGPRPGPCKPNVIRSSQMQVKKATSRHTGGSHLIESPNPGGMCALVPHGYKDSAQFRFTTSLGSQHFFPFCLSYICRNETAGRSGLVPSTRPLAFQQTQKHTQAAPPPSPSQCLDPALGSPK